MEPKEISQKIQAIDLDPIIYNLTQRHDGPKWSLARARAAEKWYRRFLFLVANYPDEAIVPTKEIDEIWHTHILDTRKYIEDCNALFGEYLHHFPYLGSRGEDDKRNLEDAFFRSLALFELHFNEMPIDKIEGSTSAICSSACIKSPAINICGIDLITRPNLPHESALA